jgi:hypothetical protein
MAVTLDANASNFVQGTGVTSITSSNLTVGAGANRAVVFQLALSLHSADGTVTGNWDQLGTPQALTLIVGRNNTGGATGGGAELWGLVNPTSGAKQVKFQWTGSSDVYVNGTAFADVDQTGGATSFPHSTSQVGSFGTITMPITSAVGNYTVAHIVEDLGSISAPTQTQAYIDNALAIGAGASYATGASPTVTHGFTVGTSPSVYVFVGTDIAAYVAPTNIDLVLGEPLIRAGVLT